MRTGASSQTLAGAAGWAPSGASWLDGRLLAESLPIDSGRLTAAAGSQVPERVQFTVPDLVDGFSWVPRTPTHPLARFGQQVDIAITVTSPTTGEHDVTRMGRFRIHSHHHDDVAGTVTVTALGMLIRPQEARFRVPEVPRVGGTLGSEFRRLMVPGVPVSIDPTLVDRACPRSFQWPQDRLAALYEIAEAWPARLRTDQWGQVMLLPPLPAVPSPVLWFTDGEGGTVVSAPTEDTREGVPNVIVGTSTVTDSVASDPLRAVSETTTGPMAVTTDGSGYGEVVEYWSSPLATTPAALRAAVDTIRADRARPTVVRTVTCAPDPRVELDDAMSVTRDGVTDWGWVVAYELPLTYDGGPMRIDVGVSA